MSIHYRTFLLVPLILISIAIFSGCSKQPEVLIAVPLCDCIHKPDDPQSDCWEGYVCHGDAECTQNGGLYDKCVPGGTYSPHEQGASY